MEIESRVTGKTKLLGVIGNPIEHTISPQLHNTISARLGLDFVYVPLRVERDDLESAVKGLKALNFIGFNVTVPYKKDVMRYINENSKEALLMGAVNTVKNLRGRLYGYNTDAEGFSRSFKEESGTGFKGKNVALIGAGGAARAIAVKIALEGANKISIINRTASRALEIAELLNSNIGTIADHYEAHNDNLEDIFGRSDIIINTTSAGMFPDTEAYPATKPINFSKGQIVYDVVYNPLKTKFIKNAEEHGCTAINGLGMLFYQGINAYEIWTGVKIPDNIVKDLFKVFKQHHEK